MKSVFKVLTGVAAVVLSLSVFAHMGSGYTKAGFQHPMMENSNPHYQAMLKLSNDPQAMQAWRENMHNNPEAMQAWMEQMHATTAGTATVSGYGCHGNWQATEKAESPE